MGYGFHITRREHWANDAGLAIELTEWLKLADSIDEFDPITVLPVTNLNLPPQGHSRCWYGHPATDGHHGPVFQLVDGRIDFGGDDPATLGFALDLAQRLHAKVFGEEVSMTEIRPRNPEDAIAAASPKPLQLAAARVLSSTALPGARGELSRARSSLPAASPVSGCGRS